MPEFNFVYSKQKSYRPIDYILHLGFGFGFLIYMDHARNAAFRGLSLYGPVS